MLEYSILDRSALDVIVNMMFAKQKQRAETMARVLVNEEEGGLRWTQE